MKEILSVGKSGNAIVTLAIGGNYLSKWEQYASPTIIEYCKINSLGLYLQDVSLDNSTTPKKFQWQKILLPAQLSKLYPKVKNFCYLDSDIIANPNKGSVFDYHINGSLSLVSQVKNLPLPLNLTQRIIAFYRHEFYSQEYPLDSALFMTPEQILQFQGFPLKDDYACMGLIMGSISDFSSRLEEIYFKYDESVLTLTGGGDEPILNHEFQSAFPINWIPYEFQAIWLFEMAWKYPFLYKRSWDSDLIRDCAESVLLGNTFLHFAGSWGESRMIEAGNFFNMEGDMQVRFSEYLKMKVTGEPKGLIRPHLINNEN